LFINEFREKLERRHTDAPNFGGLQKKVASGRPLNFLHSSIAALFPLPFFGDSRGLARDLIFYNKALFTVVNILYSKL